MTGSQQVQRRPRSVTRRPVIIAILALAGFAVLGAALHEHPGPLGVDRELADILNASKGSVPFELARVVSLLGTGPVVASVAVAIGILIWRRTHVLLLAAAVPLASATGGLLEIAAKQVVARPRPPAAALSGASGFGFPSGHTTGITALVIATVGVTILVGVRRGIRDLGIILALGSSLAVAISRVALGVHWATDVMGGLFLGTAAAIIVLLIVGAAGPVALAPDQRPHEISEG